MNDISTPIFLRRLGLTLLMVLVFPLYLLIKGLDQAMGYKPKLKAPKLEEEKGDRRWRNDLSP